MVDGYFLLESAHMMGRSEEAFDGFLSVLRHIKPDGAIRIMPLHHKETGIALAMIVRQCELVNDDGRLRELWPTMKRALEYIRSLMESAKAMGEEYKGHDLFPPAFGDGGLYGSDPEYTTPLWILAGLKRAYEAGKRLKLHDYSDFKETYDEIMKGFRKSIARDRKYTKNVQNFLELLDDIDNEEGIPENTGWLSGLIPLCFMLKSGFMRVMEKRQLTICIRLPTMHLRAGYGGRNKLWQTRTQQRSVEICRITGHLQNL
jgi:hypothetical protein